MNETIKRIIDTKLQNSGLVYSTIPFRGEDGFYHFLYVTTNKADGKFYIGIHTATRLRDGYRGSGVNIKKEFRKYGFKRFEIERYAYFKDRDSLSKAENLIVDLELLEQFKDSIYNVCTGGDTNFYDPGQGERCKQHWYSNDEVGQAMRRGFAKAKAQYKEFLETEKGLEMRKNSSEHMKRLWQDPEWRAKMEAKKKASREKHMKENPNFLKECSDKARLVNMKPIVQSKELYGEPVKVWECGKHIPKEVISQWKLKRALDEGIQMNGYYWYFLKEEHRKQK